MPLCPGVARALLSAARAQLRDWRRHDVQRSVEAAERRAGEHQATGEGRGDRKREKELKETQLYRKRKTD